MFKKDLVNKVAEKMDTTKKAAEQAVDAVLDCIEEALASGEEVRLVGFGSFLLKKRAKRTGRNPQTGEEIEIPEKIVPVFKPGKLLKDAAEE